MAEDKTCSGFGAEAKPAPAQLAQESTANIALMLAQIAANIQSMLDRGGIYEVKSGGYRQQHVLLEAARRLIERKEP